VAPVIADPAAYVGFQILVDEPATSPLLGFRAYAKAFAEMIEHSRAQFAIGIFGSWGSGKTTLMRAIEKEVTRRQNLVPVWFNAWRYEREEHLIVPLLDTLRDDLERRARSARMDATAKERARDAAEAMGRAGRAIARGLKFKVGIPFTGIGLDADLKAIEEALREPAPSGPLSFYHGAFREMEDAVRKFGEGGDRRIVVFIDDLDRCLPASALSVLESMKLFFDFEGFVFVVGLDQDVVQRAIEAKYGLAPERVYVLGPPPRGGEGAAQERAAAPGGDAAAGRPDSGNGSNPSELSGADYEVKKIGSEYVKKIFQVPFSLPRISTRNLQRFVDGMLGAAEVPEAQRTDLTENVRPHLIHLSSEGAINPREVKRLINAYTLQMKLLSASRVRNLRPEAVATLLTMSFRTEWRHLYDLLVADPGGFVDAIRAVQRSGTDEGAKLWPGDQTVPRDFLEYVGGTGRALLDVDNLERYVASVEATRTGTIELGPAQSIVVDLGRRLTEAAASGAIGADDREAIDGGWARLRDSVSQLPSLPSVSRLHQSVDVLRREIADAPWDSPVEVVKDWATRNERLLRGIYENLRQIRLLTDVGGHA
jgi:KAP family P-loop domain